MKTPLFCICFFISISSHSQVLSGFYSGTIYNDTTKMLQQYELALSEYKGKITGYSYITFVVNDTFYYGIRSIKALKKDDNLIVEDDEMLANNFPESPAKRVRRTAVFPLNEKEDTVRSLQGTWHTNPTKLYYSVGGAAVTKRDNNNTQAALFTHLKELGIKTGGGINNPNSYQEKKHNKESITISKTDMVPTQLSFEKRKENVLQTLDVINDSIVLSFYDNGVVDGDIISVYLNNQPVVFEARLTEAAIKKTIHLNFNDQEHIDLLLVAESLGSIPPNTGLLIVQDGSSRYTLHFSADFQTNATVRFRKKK
ncbi:MAG: hypothetical protein M3413_14775 [Bacteroidota bacterium]|nr:hypothetical protein [Bacteroidota bacterium]